MQANCPKCAHRIVVDDARVPDRPFGVRCPGCQTTVRFSGRAASPAGQPSGNPPAATPLSPPAPGPETAVPDDERSMPSSVSHDAQSGEKLGQRGLALVALPDSGVSGSVALMLSRLGYVAEPVADMDTCLRRLEQGLHNLVATQVSSDPNSLHRRITRLGPEARRPIILVLIGDEFSSGDGTQAFVLQADLVLTPGDVSGAEGLLRSVLGEREFIYSAFLEARRRFEQSEGA